MSLARITPGVYTTVIDKTLGLQIQGLGGIGMAAVLEKGPIGEGIVLNGRADLLKYCGNPIPDFNMLSWHYIDNIFNYTGNVIVSRVARLEDDVDGTTIKFADANAQAFAFTDGSHFDIKPSEEMQRILKLADTLSITNTIDDTTVAVWNKSILMKNDDDFTDISFPTDIPNTSLGIIDYTANTFAKGDIFVETSAADMYYKIIDTVDDNVYTFVTDVVSTASNPFAAATAGDAINLVSATATVEFGSYIGSTTIATTVGYLWAVEAIITNSTYAPETTASTAATVSIGAVTATLATTNATLTANPCLPRSLVHFVAYANPTTGEYPTISLNTATSITVCYKDSSGVMQIAETNIKGTGLSGTIYNSVDWDLEAAAGTISETNMKVPVLKFYAPTAGQWFNTSGTKIAVCSMRQYSNTENDFDDKTVAALGDATFSDFFNYGPETNDLYDGTNGLTQAKYLQSDIAIIVYNADQVLEKFIVSLDNTSKDEVGASRFIEDVVNRKSEYIRVALNDAIFSGTSKNYTFRIISDIAMTGGQGATNINSSTFVATSDASTYEYGTDVVEAYSIFEDPDDITISYLCENMWGGLDSNNAPNAIYEDLQVLCRNRGDCVAIVAPGSDIGGLTASQIETEMGYYSTGLTTGSTDGQWETFYPNAKMIYDNINDTYLWIPCSSDAVALHAFTDNNYEVWTPVAGLTRGVLRNVIKLAWSPTFNQRETLVKQCFAPIYNIKGTGSVIMDIKSLYNKKSDMASNYNRKAVNFLSKNIGTYLNQVLFEFNNEITRNRVIQTVTPFLTSVKNRDDLIDFQVVCDTSNNTAAVIENDELVVDIFLKLPHVARIISLNFIITKTSQSFTSNA